MRFQTSKDEFDFINIFNYIIYNILILLISFIRLNLSYIAVAIMNLSTTHDYLLTALTIIMTMVEIRCWWVILNRP